MPGSTVGELPRERTDREVVDVIMKIRIRDGLQPRSFPGKVLGIISGTSWKQRPFVTVQFRTIRFLTDDRRGCLCPLCRYSRRELLHQSPKLAVFWEMKEGKLSLPALARAPEACTQLQAFMVP